MNSDSDVCCGHINEPACVMHVPETDIIVHSCFSEGLPTIGAVPINSTYYMCMVCGRPHGFACECTFDNPYNLHDHAPKGTYEPPCTNGLQHWCLHGPTYYPEADEMFGGAIKCMRNTTAEQLQQEQNCGLLGERACLDSGTSISSCASPGPDGSTVRAMQPDGDAKAPTMCLSCNKMGPTKTKPMCPATFADDDTKDGLPGSCRNKVKRSMARYQLNSVAQRASS